MRDSTWSQGVRAVMAGIAFLSIFPCQLSGSGYSLDDWMTVGGVRSFLWAPDGDAIYFTRHPGDSGTTEIFRVEISDGSTRQLSSNPDGKPPQPKEDLSLSVDGKNLLFTMATYVQEYHDIYMMPSSGGQATALTFNEAVIETHPSLSPDGRTLAYFARTGRGTKIFLKDLSAKNSWPRLMLPGNEEELFPIWSPDGSRIAFSRGGDIWVTRVTDFHSAALIEASAAGSNSSPAWSPDGTRIAFLKDSSGYSQVGVVDVETGHVTPVTYEPREHSDQSWSPDGKTLVFIRSDETGMSTDVVTAPADGTGVPSVLTGGKAVRSSPRFSPDGRWIGYVESSASRTADIWITATAGATPRQLTNSMGRIDPSGLSEPISVTYPGPDDLPIPTLLYKPRNFEPGRKYPVIVLLHGHPGQWNYSFQLMWQYFLDRGYVLIAPNPRGSVGFGQGFHDLHIADYGGTELEDILRVLDFLREQPFVDMARKATWGGSGGGYMSLLIATRAPTAFQAQVIRAPVSSWKLLAIDRYGASGRHWTATRTPRRERSEFGGAYDEIPEEYDLRSPLNFVENVEVPQLLFHGLRDAAVPPRQSKVWVERMRALGKGNLLEYIEYPHEDHSLRRYQSTIRDRLERMERFLAGHLDLGGADR